jgi:hypothetical protein
LLYTSVHVFHLKDVFRGIVGSGSGPFHLGIASSMKNCTIKMARYQGYGDGNKSGVKQTR